MQTWQLPEFVADILPSTARQLESAREQLLALFRLHGFELVQPPLMEYSTSLLTHIDAGLSLKTIRVVDQISGRQLGMRADITPQVARIDAHLLSANQGINRLCYAGSVLHARPDGLLNTREPMQVGAELYGLDDASADIELIDLMLKSLKIAHTGEILLSLGHIKIFRALADAAGLSEAQSLELLALMQDKDADVVGKWTEQWEIDSQWCDALQALPKLYGDASIIDTARDILPALPDIERALDELAVICRHFPNQRIHIDLSELRVDNYHTGLLYAAYDADSHDAIARGGRYDGLGAYFGRSRPATGFSFDLRHFIGRLPHIDRLPAIKVAAKDVEAAREVIESLREDGQCVVIDYGIESNASRDYQSELIFSDGKWIVRALTD